MLATRERWQELCQRNGAKNNPKTGRTIDSTYDEIAAIYTGPDRHYHDLSHISDSIKIFDEAKKEIRIFDLDSIEAGQWGHDIVNRPSEYYFDEIESARIFCKMLCELGFSMPFIKRVSSRIYSTKHNHIPENFEDQVIASIDLVPLALPPRLFDKNTEKVREEWRNEISSNRMFAILRAGFLRDIFLNGRPYIYPVKYFRDKYEEQARKNIQRYIDKVGI